MRVGGAATLTHQPMRAHIPWQAAEAQARIEALNAELIESGELLLAALQQDKSSAQQMQDFQVLCVRVRVRVCV